MADNTKQQIEETKEKFEQQLADLADAAYQFVKKEVIRIAKENNLSRVASLWSLEVLDEDGDELDKIDCPIYGELSQLIFWCDDTFPRMGEFIFENGEWKD